MKKYLNNYWVLSILLLSLLFTACSSEDLETSAVENDQQEVSVEDTNNTSSKNVTNQEESSTEPEVPTEFYIGQHVQIGDLVLVVNDLFESNGSDLFKPDDGYIYQIADLTFYNVGDSPYNLSSMFGFELVDEDFYTYTPDWMVETKGSLDGTIMPEKKLRGQTGFQIPIDSEPKELIFDYDLGISGQVIFNLDPTMIVTDETFSYQTKTFVNSNIGDSVESNGIVYTLNGIRFDKGSDYFKAKDGNTFLIADITVTNNSSETITVSTLMSFSVVDADGYFYNADYGPTLKGNIGGDLAAGRSNRGEIAFQVPENTNYELVIEPDFLDSILFYFNTK